MSFLLFHLLRTLPIGDHAAWKTEVSISHLLLHHNLSITKSLKDLICMLCQVSIRQIQIQAQLQIQLNLLLT